MNSLKKLLVGLEKRFKVSALVAPVLIMGEVLLEVLIPLIMARIIDVGITNHDVGFVVKYGLLMIGAALLSLGFGFLAGKYAAIASVGFARNVRRNLFNKIQDFSFGNVDKFSTSSLVTRLTTDVTNTQNTFQMIIRLCVRAPFMFVSAIIMSFYINSKMALIFIVAIPLIAVPAGIIMKKAFPRFQEMMKNYDMLNGAVQENLIGIRAVKAFVREKDEIERFRIVANAVRTSQVKAEKLVILNMPIMQLVMYLSIIAILWFGGNFIIAGSMQMGELISFITYLTQILMSLMMISMIFVMLTISKTSADRILEVLEEDSTIKNPENPIMEVKDGSIDFENVSFRYSGGEDKNVLENIDIHIKSGETVGIIGATGSSKSTFVQLIPRLYDVSSGSVKVGGVDVRDYDMEVLRNEVSMVLQKNVLFSGTILDNLRWGNENATLEEAKHACELAQAAEFIERFPDGYDTMIERGGTNVSGGQKQRLCIARALLKKPKILILDDSTSAVDTATDAKIRKAFREEIPNTTKLIIAQRISSVQEADHIIVLEQGMINGYGTHEELLENNAIYKDIYELQQKGAEE